MRLKAKIYTMMAHQNICNILAEFISSMDAAKVLAFYAPKDLQTRIEQLIQKKRNCTYAVRAGRIG